MKKFPSYSSVQPYCLCKRNNICIHRLADICHFINKTDLNGKKCVCSIFYKLGSFKRGLDKRRRNKVKRVVHLFHYFNGPFRVSADNHAVRPHKIINCRAFAQEFRIRDNIKISIRILLFHNSLNLSGCPDRHRAFVYNNGIPF